MCFLLFCILMLSWALAKLEGGPLVRKCPFHKAWTRKGYVSVFWIWAVVQPFVQLWAFPLQSMSNTWHSGDSRVVLKLHRFHPLWIDKKCLLLKNYVYTPFFCNFCWKNEIILPGAVWSTMQIYTQDGCCLKFGSLSWIYRKAEAQTMNTAAFRKDSLNVSLNIQKSWGSSPRLVPSFSSGMGIRNICCHKQKLLQSSRVLFISSGISLFLSVTALFSALFPPFRSYFAKFSKLSKDPRTATGENLTH